MAWLAVARAQARRGTGSVLARSSAGSGWPCRIGQGARRELNTGEVLTKVVCTLGPSSDNEAMVGKLVESGMNVARLNFSHVTKDYSEPLFKADLVRQAAGQHAKSGWQQLPKNVRAVLVDTKGPEIRTQALVGGLDVVQLEQGSAVELTTSPVHEEPLDPKLIRLAVDYPALVSTVQPGGQVLLDDGLVELRVVEVRESNEEDGGSVMCQVMNSGEIKANKGVNLPGVSLNLPALTEKDKQDLRWAVSIEADYVAASFIRTAANVRSCIAFLERCVEEEAQTKGSRPLRPLVISKIESEEGVENFAEILEASDGIMVARGDLGVEIPFEKVFAAQKMMVQACNRVGKPVIVATQMLDSMMRQPRPTRAEVTDVGTAVLDGADAVMLSGETAAGKYPLESIKAMVSIIKEADSIVRYSNEKPVEAILESKVKKIHAQEDIELHAVAEAAVHSAGILGVQSIIVLAGDGAAARAIASKRPQIPVFAFCYDPRVARQLQLHRAINPILFQTNEDEVQRMGMKRAEAVRTLKELGVIQRGDRAVIVDQAWGETGDNFKYATNLKVFTVG